MKYGIGVMVALGAFFIAAFLMAIVPASECSSRYLPHPFLALFPFLVYLWIGFWLFAKGPTVAHVFLFAGTALIVALYAIGLSMVLPMIYDEAAGCAARAERQASR